MKFYRFLLISLFIACFVGQASLISTEAPQIPEPSTSFGEEHFWEELVNMLFTLGFVLLVLIGLVWVMKRMQQARVQQGNASGEIQIVDCRPLSAKSSIYLLHIHGRAIVVSESVNGVTQLSEFSVD